MARLTAEQKHRYAEDLIDRFDLRITVESLRKLLANMPGPRELRRTLATYPPRVVLRRMLPDCQTVEERDEVVRTLRERKDLERQLEERLVTEAALDDAKDRLAADKTLTKAELKIIRSYEATTFSYQPPSPKVPCLEAPGPAKVDVLARRAASGLGLWMPGEDAQMTAPDDGTEYDPVCADGNNTLIDRSLRTPKAQLPGKGKWRERLSLDAEDD